MSAYILVNTEQEAEDIKRQLLSIAGVFTVNLYYSKFHNKYEVKINAGTAIRIGLPRGEIFTREQLKTVIENNPKK
jgi:hypothetical protein